MMLRSSQMKFIALSVKGINAIKSLSKLLDRHQS